MFLLLFCAEINLILVHFPSHISSDAVQAKINMQKGSCLWGFLISWGYLVEKWLKSAEKENLNALKSCLRNCQSAVRKAVLLAPVAPCLPAATALPRRLRVILITQSAQQHLRPSPPHTASAGAAAVVLPQMISFLFFPFFFSFDLHVLTVVHLAYILYCYWFLRPSIQQGHLLFSWR